MDKPFTREYDYITIGKRARDFILRTGQNLSIDFSDEIKDTFTSADSRRMVRTIINLWNSEKYSKVSIVYNHYVSAITQLPVIKPLFPIKREDIFSFLEKVVGKKYEAELYEGSYTIEPDAETIVTMTIPLILDGIVHETLLEAKASEHAARMVAMKNAKDSANKKAT